MKRVFSIVFALALVLAFSLVATTPVAAAATYYVDDSGSDSNGGTSWGDAWLTIQYAVDNVASGDTIMVGAGTYDNTVNVVGFAGLTISGVDKTQVIIRPSSTINWDVGGYGGARQTVFRIVNSTDVVLENLTMNFDLVAGNGICGILYWDSTGTVNNNILKNMSVSDAGGGYTEITSYYRADGYSDGNRAGITISNNTFIDPGRLGACLHTFVDATITGNTFYKTTDDFGYAIELGSESTGTISDNTIYGYDTAALSDGSQSGGIYVENCYTYGDAPMTKAVSVTNNEIYDCQWGLWVGNEWDGYAGDVDIVLDLSDNNFHDNTIGGAVIADEDKEYGSSVSISGGGNCLARNDGYGYYIYTQGDGDITISLTGDTVTGHDTGVCVEDTAGGLSSSLYSIAIQSSNIVGNTLCGINNTVSSFALDASSNWWGAADGPGPIAGGGGDGVTTNVDYSSYLSAPYTSQQSVGAPGGTAYFTPDDGSVAGLTAVTPPAGAPAGVTFPYGMFNFTICCFTGTTVTLDITLPGSVPVGYKWYKYNSGAWDALDIDDDDGDNFIQVTLTDGNVTQDEDGTLNGQIIDQGGVGGPGAVGWESYPVSKVRVLLPWIALLAAIAAGVSLLVLRRRRAQS